LQPKKHTTPKKLHVIDGREVNSGLVTEFITFSLVIRGHTEQIECHVVNIGNNDLVLGMSWLNKHYPSIQWDERTIAFSSPYCSKNCLLDPHVIQINGTELPEIYQEFAKVFSEEEASKLPPHRPYDISIDLLPDAKPKHGPIYSHNMEEDKELRETIQKQLASGWIRPSTSPMASPILFVKKKDGSRRMCVDYRRLNAMTVKNSYPLPLTQGLIEKLEGAKIFTKLDLKSGYSLCRIKEGDEWKTAFKTKYGLFKYLIMPFGLSNAPATFQALMNEIFRDLLDIYVIIYLDHILIFSKTEDKHSEHVKEVLRRLQANNLYCNAKKCTFHVTEIDYLGLIVDGPCGTEL
jgi:hypothetical protein